MSYIEIFDKVEKKMMVPAHKRALAISNQRYPCYNTRDVFGPSRFHLDPSVLERNALVLVSGSYTNRLMCQ